MSKIEKSGILLSLLILFISLQGFGQQPSSKSDREQKGLIGTVAKVRFALTYFKQEGEKWVESERGWDAEWEFDRAGKLINLKTFDTYGDARICDEKYKYDDKGRKTVKFCTEGDKEKILEKYRYEEDNHGNWTKQIASRAFGETFRVQWILYREITYFN